MSEPLYVIVDRCGHRWKPVPWEVCLRLVKVYRRHVRCVEAYTDSRPRSEVPIGTPVSRTDLFRWRLCLLLACCCAIYAVAVSSAAAFPLKDDLAVARIVLPADHPCRSRVDVRWVPGLTSRDGHAEDGHADLGYRVAPGVWLARTTTGEPLALSCVVEVNASTRFTGCERRRLVMHEVGHLAGLPDAHGGLMDTGLEARERVAVPGCRAFVPSVSDRVTDVVLSRVPRGWATECGPRRGRVIHCTADDGRGHSRRFGVRLADRVGTTFKVKRIKR